ncbi:MAG TPA: hypothetical protein PK867_26295 [Pirellulales bacterium]|nr:hypothetical protein [Pirellulales bacterium]
MRNRARPSIVKPPSPNVTFRVLRLPEPLRVAMRSAKQAEGLPNRQWLTAAVNAHLANVVDHLEQLGIGGTTGPMKPARLPFDNAVLASLKTASKKTGLPAITLLRACLSRATAGERSRGSAVNVRGKRAAKKIRKGRR